MLNYSTLVMKSIKTEIRYAAEIIEKIKTSSSLPKGHFSPIYTGWIEAGIRGFAALHGGRRKAG
jgi:hypothetical protein